MIPVLKCMVTLWLASSCHGNAGSAPIIKLNSTCTYTMDSNQNVILCSGCTAADLLVDAAARDFRLVPNSPAIGRAACIPQVSTDIVGNPRPTPGAGCDMGAYQYVPSTPPPVVPSNLR